MPRLLLVVVALLVSVSTASVCSTDLDCSLLGVCKTGQCVCDKGWRGNQCQFPSLAPFTFSGYVNVNQSMGSWGGNTYQTPDGKHHLFFSEFANSCPERMFYNASQFSHAVADDFTGNFTKIGVVRAPEAHNAEIRQAPDGTFLIYAIAPAKTYPPSHCENGPPPCCPTPRNCSCHSPGGRPVSVFSSPSLDGPWTYNAITSNITKPTDIKIATNPTVTFLPNGTVIMAYRGNPPAGGEAIGVATAPHWSGPFTPIATVVTAQDGIGSNEDPFLWIDPRGNFHIITHNQATASLCGGIAQCAAHFYSEDAINWHWVNEPFYNNTAVMADGSVQIFHTRQRPKLSFNADGSPAALWQGGAFVGDGWADLHILTHTYYIPFTK